MIALLFCPECVLTPFCSGGPSNATHGAGKTLGVTRANTINGTRLPREPDPSPFPLLPFPTDIPLPTSAPSSSVLSKAPCTSVLLTRVQSVAAAVLHRLFCGASILHVHAVYVHKKQVALAKQLTA